MFKTKKSSAAPAAGELVFSSTDVARTAGVSLRQLQWWDEQKVVSPRHAGHKRLYQTEEVVEVAIIAELRRKGFSLQKIRRTLKLLQKETAKRLPEVLNTENEFYLLTDGRSIHLEEAPERIVQLMKNARQPMFLISVSDQVRRFLIPPRKPVRTETAGAEARRTRAL